ncbi:MAG: GNAT family N-acetyltransferase [Burkholderiales bacterium]|nr:GNAT family N-acetyltransferase [Burkholderiales bacterium]
MNSSLELEIEFAALDDCEAIAALHARSWKEAYRGMLSDHYLDFKVDDDRLKTWRARFANPKYNQRVICARKAQKIVAFACAFFCDDDDYGTFIDNLHVAAEYRNRGVGAMLVSRVINMSMEQHEESRVFLWVLASNQSAINFYERIGGRRVEEAYWTPPDGGSYLKYRYVWTS